MLSGKDEQDLLKAYDRALEEEADADVALEDEVHWDEERQWVSNSIDLGKMILQEHHS